MIPIEVSEVLAAYDGAPKTQVAQVAERVRGMGQKASADEQDIERVAKLYTAIRTFVDSDELDGIAIKCWPELKDRFLNPCVVNGIMTGEGVMVGCETDVHGTISMLIEHYLSGDAVFFADLVTFDEKENTALFWHCGAASAQLAAQQDLIQLEKHSIGTGSATLEFPLRSGRVTVTRLGPIETGYRLLILSGEAVKTPMLLRGNNILVNTELPVRQVIGRIIDKGIEHHYALAYGDLRQDLLELCKWADLQPETLES